MANIFVTRSASGGSGSSPPSVTGTVGTNLGATATMALTAARETWLAGTLNANLTVTLSAFPSGAKGRIYGKQDATGARTLTITDGITPQTITIPTAAGASFEVLIDAPDGVVNYYSMQGADPYVQRAKILTADMTAITSSTTLIDVAGGDGSSLSVPISATSGEKLIIRYRLILTGANATMDAKLGFTFPAGTTAEGGQEGIGAGVTIPGYGTPAVGSAPTINLPIQTTVVTIGTGVAIRQGVSLFYVVYGGGTAGTWQIQVAQNTSDAGALQVRTGSTVEYARVA